MNTVPLGCLDITNVQVIILNGGYSPEDIETDWEVHVNASQGKTAETSLIDMHSNKRKNPTNKLYALVLALVRFMFVMTMEKNLYCSKEKQ